MKFLRFLRHLFLPHESNNQKAKILHPSTLSLIAVILIVFQLFLSLPGNLGAKILGYAANISPEEVIRLTNEKRVQAGLTPLNYSPILSQSAQAKGADMLNKSYWAHVAPDGTQPWKFFTDAGYQYRYAGENLARDFSNPSSAVDAWMASPSHKENMLSSKYKEIGVAVVEGNLAGVDTTIIVEHFGTKYVDTIPAVPLAEAKTATPAPPIIPTASPVPLIVSTTPSASPTSLLTSGEGIVGTKSNILISPFSTTKKVSLTVVTILLVVLVIDAFVTSRRRIVRIGGRTFAHLAFLGMIAVIVLILKAGQVL